MEKTRLYEVRVSEYCDAAYNDSCIIAVVDVRSKSANEAADKALEKVKNEIELEGLFVSSIKCTGSLTL